MAEGFDIVSYLVGVCPALGILAWVVIHLKSEISKKDARNEALTDEIIDMTRDQIKVNTETKNVLELFIKKQK